MLYKTVQQLNFMKIIRKLFIASLFTLLHYSSFAQSAYTFSFRSETYVPLTNDSVVSPSVPWAFKNITIPVGFNFKLGDSILNTVYAYSSGNLIATDTTGVASGFHITDATLCDRVHIILPPNSSNAVSKISYNLTGANGSRILKIQFSNMGIFEEIANFGVSDDSVNAQVWLYEGSNAVELHYGPSSVLANWGLYQAGGSMEGFLKNVDLDNMTPTFERFSYVSGSTSSYVLDSITPATISSATPANLFPPNGTVFKFTPVATTSVNKSVLKAGDIHVYPTYVNDRLYVQSATGELKYTVTNMYGQTTADGVLHKTNDVITTDTWIPGMYIVVLDNGKGQSVAKVYKQ